MSLIYHFFTKYSSNTSIIVPGRYVYDVTVNDGANTVTRIVEGIVTVLPSVTR
jgi:hypothetical protein